MPDDASIQISDDVKLCISCGLCCTGVLFAYAPLESDNDDVEIATKFDLGVQPLPKSDGRQAFRLPCVCWDEKCTIYPDRPKICGSYRCHLLKKLDRGEVELEQALEKVRRTKGFVTSVIDGLGDTAQDLHLWDRINDFRKSVANDEADLNLDKAEHAALMLNVGMLLATLKEFEPDLYSKEVPNNPSMTEKT